MKKILVIGSNSFSGSAFIKHALLNNFEVIGMSRSAEPHSVFLPHRWLNAKVFNQYQYYQRDLNHHLDSMMSLIHEKKPSYIVNFAAQGMVAESWVYPVDWMMTNVVSTVKFHEQLRKCKFLKKYVHVSTPEVYGSTQGLVLTSAPYNPSTPYAISRAAADMWLTALYKNYKFPVVFTRSANVYGPGQQLYRIIPKTIMSIKLNKRLPLHGGGHSVRSFIHIQDVVDGTLRVLLNAEPGKIYHFSTQRNISIRDVVRLICCRMKINLEDVVDMAEERPGKDAAYLLDSDRTRHELAWKDNISLEEGIDQTIEWVGKNIEVLKIMPSEYIHKP
ncbi:MAG: GDP-mannose 4,6-dehydratase [Gammaproteobacteria bacterium]|nr:GDP-mannose 4,6-dehydratase [Gammaproteobacteria bacterium]